MHLERTKCFSIECRPWDIHREARVKSTARPPVRYSHRGAQTIATTRVRTLTGEGNEQDFRVDRGRDVHGGNWLRSCCRPRGRAGQEGRCQDGEEVERREEEEQQEKVGRQEIRRQEVRRQDGQEVT